MIFKRVYKKCSQTFKVNDYWDIIKILHTCLYCPVPDLKGVKYIIEIE